MRRITKEIYGSALLVNADALRLQQTFVNILDNAIRFSPENGFVFVTTERTSDSYRVSLSDQGAGLPPSELELLFQPFAQRRAQPRTGKCLELGLAIARSIIDAHAGRIWAVSSMPGATFHIELPLLASAVASLPAEEITQRLDRLKVLYIED